MSGKVYLVGAGPGAPDLLTLRAARLLGEADVVLHDALVHPDTLALAARAERIPVGKRCGRQSSAQRFINKRLVDAARRHRIVVRLKGGDPMLFGRAQEEISALEHAGIECEVVPGVTAALAAAADLGVSLTQRGAARSVAFVTPRVGEGEAPSQWARTVAAADTAVIYMGAGLAGVARRGRCRWNAGRACRKRIAGGFALGARHTGTTRSACRSARRGPRGDCPGPRSCGCYRSPACRSD